MEVFGKHSAPEMFRRSSKGYACTLRNASAACANRFFAGSQQPSLFGKQCSRREKVYPEASSVSLPLGSLTS